MPEAMSAVHAGNAERKNAHFPPSIWGDHFLNPTSHLMTSVDSIEQAKIRELKAEVKQMLDADDTNFPIKLNLIDQVQRLGIGYLFEGEIDNALERIHRVYFDCGTSDLVDYHDLHNTALLFRLLRQQGYRISCNVFDKFKDMSKSGFKDSIVADTRGLLSLYEASHLRVHEEDILEEALEFIISHLKQFPEGHGSEDDQKHKNDRLLACQVNHALKQCMRKGLTRIEARRYITTYEQEGSHSKVLLTLAKLDFNLLQNKHQKELRDIARWWNNMEFGKKFPFARDRIVECYFWILGVYFEPQYELARMILGKVMALTSIMDDIYDAYGTPEELQLLTDAIERWDFGEKIYSFPDYLKVFCEAMFDVFEEIDHKLADDEGKSYRMFYAKESFKLQARVYFEESKWLNQPGIPTYEEYMSLALLTSGYTMLVLMSYLGMGHVAKKHTFIWCLDRTNKIVMASATVCRLMDDIVTHKFEQKRGHVPSAVECFMNQHGVTEQRAKEELWKEVDDAWKDINEVCLRPHTVPEPLLTRVLNFARVIVMFYKDKDRYTHPDLEQKQTVASILIDPITM